MCRSARPWVVLSILCVAVTASCVHTPVLEAPVSEAEAVQAAEQEYARSAERAERRGEARPRTDDRVEYDPDASPIEGASEK